jgi:hypothetical protein
MTISHVQIPEPSQNFQFAISVHDFLSNGGPTVRLGAPVHGLLVEVRPRLPRRSISVFIIVKPLELEHGRRRTVVQMEDGIGEADTVGLDPHDQVGAQEVEEVPPGGGRL